MVQMLFLAHLFLLSCFILSIAHVSSSLFWDCRALLSMLAYGSYEPCADR